jgi:formylglycine-generating enzyme required for sulfatase activity
MLLVAIPVLLIIVVLIWKTGTTESGLSKAIPRPTPNPIPSGMALVPGATFFMGSDDGDEFERPRHAVTVPPFYIDIHEVTSQEYAEFVKETGHRPPHTWRDAMPSAQIERLPVTGVDWYDANAYARWRKKRLPTEEEWELAARTQSSWRYPWGNDWRPNAANAGTSSAKHLVEVGQYPAGNNPQGVMDLIGNAWEWTASDLKAYDGGALSHRPTVTVKVIRGGSWQENAAQATSSYRGYLRASGAGDYSSTGLRCVQDLDQKEAKNQ